MTTVTYDNAIIMTITIIMTISIVITIKTVACDKQQTTMTTVTNDTHTNDSDEN